LQSHSSFSLLGKKQIGDDAVISIVHIIVVVDIAIVVDVARVIRIVVIRRTQPPIATRAVFVF